MRKWPAAFTLILTCTINIPAPAQTATTPAAAPAWADPANWKSVKPTETPNIVYATVSRIPNPSAAAAPDPGTPNGIRTPVPNTGAPGTMDLHVDVYQVPSDKPTAVILQIHGGGWIRGDRPTSYGSFGAFFSAGMSVVTVQYRNAIDAPAPGAIQDVRCAMAWVKANARKYNFDLNRVVAWGGSAGGHLALMAGYAPASFNPPGCTDQPSIAAVLDDYGASNVAEALTYPGSRSFTHQWIGTDLPLPPDPAAPAPENGRPAPIRWPDPDAKTLSRANEVSPITYIHLGLPPTFIVNGDNDHTYEPTQSYQLKKALDAAGVPNGEYVVVGGGHGNFSPAENQKAMLLRLQFLQAHGVIQ
jgi:acetyl esterase/lipase